MEPCPFVVSSVIRMYPVYPCIMYPAGFVVCMRNYYLKLTYSQKQLKFRLKSLPSDGIHYYIVGNECTMCVIVNQEGLLQFALFD